MVLKNFRKKRVIRKLGIVLLLNSLMSLPALAADPSELAQQAIGAEGGQKALKELISSALLVSRSKPVLSTATAIVCLACVPVAGAAASPGLCVSCGILIAKIIG